MSYTPMIRQYLTIKEQAGDALLFFRLGDFYEMFFDDAKLASKLLEITLTGREGGGEERIPMCGVPYHSAEIYIQRLVDQGYKVAICEQVEAPDASKGIVRREIVQIVTPGTRVSPEGDSKPNSSLLQYLVAVIPSADCQQAGIAACDVGTGEFFVIEKPAASVSDFLQKIAPSELVSVSAAVKEWIPDLGASSCVWTEYTIKERPADWSDYLLNYFSLQSLDQFSFADRPLAAGAA
ncbi:MAG: mismatch repair protein MutS, partial [Bacilli bacterium]|nr:mismatch repair protein MutS [Bacilli bacterium]